METPIKYFRFDALLMQQGWMKPAYVGVDATGLVKYLSEKPVANGFALEVVNGIAIPGFPNAHSHSFQFAMAGMAEKHQPGTTDDFWTWREAMYECALKMTPDQIESVSTMLYTQMLRNGITQVTEFHYLHHDLNGQPYTNVAETGERIVSAAKKAGIRITLVPIFYQRGGFGKNPQVKQRRFISKGTEQYFRLLEASRNAVGQYQNARLGFGVHSLRAVTATDVFKTVEEGPRELPFHIHAAEQKKEVEECQAHLHNRPVEWLLNNLPLNDRFNLVHCTHMNGEEIVRLAQSRANVVICPSTEGNLGDGVFPLREFAGHYGNWCIGTDSQINLDPLEDLRWIDYSQRLQSHRRNTYDDAATELINKTIMCGRSSAGEVRENFFEEGRPFDAVVFDSNTPTLYQSRRDHLLQAMLYTARNADIMGTIVNGRWVVKGGKAENEIEIVRDFKLAINAVWS